MWQLCQLVAVWVYLHVLWSYSSFVLGFTITLLPGPFFLASWLGVTASGWSICHEAFWCYVGGVCQMWLGHVISTSYSLSHVCSTMCKVNRNGGPQSRYRVMLYIFRKALEKQRRIFHVLEWGCTLHFCFLWKAGSDTSVMGNGTEYQTMLSLLLISYECVYHFWQYIWAMEVMNVWWTMGIHSWNDSLSFCF